MGGCAGEKERLTPVLYIIQIKCNKLQRWIRTEKYMCILFVLCFFVTYEVNLKAKNKGFVLELAIVDLNKQTLFSKR